MTKKLIRYCLVYNDAINLISSLFHSSSDRTSIYSYYGLTIAIIDCLEYSFLKTFIIFHF